MSRCIVCGSHGECHSGCGANPIEQADQIDELEYDFQSLERRIDKAKAQIKETLEYIDEGSIDTAKYILKSIIERTLL